MRIKFAVVASFLALLQFVAHAQTKTEILTNKSVIDMHKAGIDDDIIVSKIESSECKFDLTTTGLIDLKNKGVPSTLVKIMMSKADGKPITYSAPSNSTASAAPGKNKTATTKSPGYASIELLNHVYCWNKSTQTGKPLEKSIAGVKHYTGMFKAKDAWHLDGLKSGVRLSSSDASDFVINTGGNALAEFVLFNLTVAKGAREVVSATGGTFSGVKGSKDMISINITKLAEGIYEVVPGVALKKGEYFFTIKPANDATTTDAFAFGID